MHNTGRATFGFVRCYVSSRDAGEAHRPERGICAWSRILIGSTP